MFISIVRERRSTSRYECTSYHIEPIGPTKFLITFDDGTVEGRASYDTTEEGLGIYVENDRGRTIDTIFRSPVADPASAG